MEISKNALVALVIGTILTVILTSVITWLVSTSSAGIDAAERARILSIMNEELQTADGRSFGAAISTLDSNVHGLTINYDNLDKNMDLMRRALESIARQQPNEG